jgi:type II secretory pathway component PulM
MVKIDLEKVRSLTKTNSRKNSTLPHFNTSRARSRISQLSPRTIRILVAIAVFFQALICWRVFFPPKRSYIAGPPYNVTETVALVTEWYEVLRDLRYLGADSIAYPPHVDKHKKSTVNVTLARNFGLSERVIETILELPYINFGSKSDSNPGWMGDRGILWRNGHFVDYRKDEDLWLALDPLQRADHSWAPEDVAKMTMEERILQLEAIPKSVVPLSTLRNPSYALVLLLDTSTNRLLVYDTQSGGQNSDSFFQRWDAFDGIPWEYRIPGRFYGMENIHARHAPDVLRELITKTANLETGYVPGSVRTDEHYTPELSPPKWETWVRDLYYRHGWPTPNTLWDRHYPSFSGDQNTTSSVEPLQGFDVLAFDEEMPSLRRNITARYMQDWYCPVPRAPEVIGRLQNSLHPLTEEQVAFALSNELAIPHDLSGWGGSLIWQSSWKYPE